MNLDGRPRGLTPEDDQWIARHWSLTQHSRPVPARRRLTFVEEMVIVFVVVAAAFCGLMLAAITLVVIREGTGRAVCEVDRPERHCIGDR